MKSENAPLAILVTCWILICSALTVLITGGLFTSRSLVVFITLSFTPALFKPLAKVMLFFRPRTFVLMKKRHRVWLHLNPWLSVGQPGLREMNGYWHALTDTLRAAMNMNRHTIILSSHLLSPRRTARLLRYFPAEHYRSHILSRHLSRAERTGLQIDKFLKEWRWYIPSKRCGVLVIRKKDNARQEGMTSMLSWKLMKATERACRNIFEEEEAAFHYKYKLSRFNRLKLWVEGFIAGWLQEKECKTVLGQIIHVWKRKSR